MAEAAAENRGFLAQGDYEDFSLQRLLLGYGIPALVAVLLATIIFSYRDV